MSCRGQLMEWSFCAVNLAALRREGDMEAAENVCYFAEAVLFVGIATSNVC